MNTDMLYKIKEAKKYQMKALQVLLPESAGEHLEIIERELSEMLKECCIDLVKKEAYHKANEDTAQAAKGKRKTKKVDIN